MMQNTECSSEYLSIGQPALATLPLDIGYGSVDAAVVFEQIDQGFIGHYGSTLQRLYYPWRDHNNTGVSGWVARLSRWQVSSQTIGHPPGDIELDDTGRNSLLALDQLDDGMYQPVGGRRHAQRFATPHDIAVHMMDLTALAARQVLRGRRVLTRHRVGDFADGRIDIARNGHAIGICDCHAFIDEVAHDDGHALAFHEPAVR